MNENAIKVFEHEQFGEIRIIDEKGEPWFVAIDIATVLGYAKTRNAISRHCRKATTVPKQDGGYMTLIPESDLYRLILRSKLPSAEKFQDWVTAEVLPSIRKTGSYSVHNELASADIKDKTAYMRQVNLLIKELPAGERRQVILDTLEKVGVRINKEKEVSPDILKFTKAVVRGDIAYFEPLSAEEPELYESIEREFRRGRIIQPDMINAFRRLFSLKISSKAAMNMIRSAEPFFSSALSGNGVRFFKVASNLDLRRKGIY